MIRLNTMDGKVLLTAKTDAEGKATIDLTGIEAGNYILQIGRQVVRLLHKLSHTSRESDTARLSRTSSSLPAFFVPLVSVVGNLLVARIYFHPLPVLDEIY